MVSCRHKSENMKNSFYSKKFFDRKFNSDKNKGFPSQEGNFFKECRKKP